MSADRPRLRCNCRTATSGYRPWRFWSRMRPRKAHFEEARSLRVMSILFLSPLSAVFSKSMTGRVTLIDGEARNSPDGEWPRLNLGEAAPQDGRYESPILAATTDGSPARQSAFQSDALAFDWSCSSQNLLVGRGPL
jgi:hypothetical protein